jgi:hypothetical protein
MHLFVISYIRPTSMKEGGTYTTTGVVAVCPQLENVYVHVYSAFDVYI